MLFTSCPLSNTSGTFRLKQLVLDIFRSRLDHTKPTIPAKKTYVFPKQVSTVVGSIESILLSRMFLSCCFSLFPHSFFSVGGINHRKLGKFPFPPTSTKNPPFPRGSAPAVAWFQLSPWPGAESKFPGVQCKQV